MKLLFSGLTFFSSYLVLLFSNPAFKDNESNYKAITDSIAISSIKIKRVSFDASIHKNEFGYNSGWIELGNNSNQAICLQNSHWSLSNNSLHPELYLIRKDVLIAPHAITLVWCDKLNGVQQDLHSNFKLNPNAGNVSLFYINSEQKLQLVSNSNYSNLNKELSSVE